MPEAYIGKQDLLNNQATLIADILTALEDIGITHWSPHGRFRVYPQDTDDTAPLASPAVANTFGNWAEIIPLNTVPFPFHVVGFVIETVTKAATVYFIQLGYNIINADPGANMEMGERRIYINTQPIARATEVLDIRGQGVPANSRIMGRLKTSSLVAETVELSVVLTRHIPTSDEPALWPAFPW